MRHILPILLLLAASASAQTVKSLGYNTTNGRVVYTGTNALTLTNKLTLPSDASHSGTSTLALQISTNNSGWYVSTSAPNALVGVHNGSVSYALTTNVFILYKPLRYNSTAVGATNAPTNTTNAVAWIEVQVGTNSYRTPLYQ